MTRFAVGLIVAVVLPFVAFAQAERTITVHKVTDKIYMLEGQGGNIGVSVGDDGLLMIDTQFAYMVPAIEDAFKKLDHGDLKYIINTHFHGDHTGGNRELGKKAPIVAHENVLARLSKQKDADTPDGKKGLPSITYPQSWKIKFNGEDVEAIHYPNAHTDGDSIIFFRGSNVVHTGDDFTNGMFPFVDLANGGSVNGYLTNTKDLLAKLPDDVKIIPGHGPLATKADLQNFLARIEESVNIIKKQADAGKTAKEIIDSHALDSFEDYGKAFVSVNRWIGMVHQDVTKK
ncbi:MAG: MBL fold metallo-hydrolase [Candidatus Hydrogenedentota bacterium]